MKRGKVTNLCSVCILPLTIVTYAMGEAISVPSPREFRADPLPKPLLPPEYQVEIADGGGLRVSFDGHTYVVGSSYSYPHGGYNRLADDYARGDQEPGWGVRVTRRDKRVQAQGAHYRVDRKISPERTRIIVRDTVTNLTEGVLGIMISNYIATSSLSDGKSWIPERSPIVFVTDADTGLGLFALDDLYQMQLSKGGTGGEVGLYDHHFGLDASAAYTLEWAIYPVGSSDRFNFVNQIRRDERLHGHAEGPLVLIDRHTMPSKKLMAVEPKYVVMMSTADVPDDPNIAVEGWEYMEYPGERDLLAKGMADIKRQYPHVKPMFHVAPSLYATNRPGEQFPNSRIIDEHGRQKMYNGNKPEYYRRYFSKAYVAEGWRWYLFYPTLDNRFGELMIEANEYMMTEMNAEGLFGDGLFSMYGGGYSYDRWDGHSVTIDRETKTVTRKKFNIAYGALPVLDRVIRTVNEHGGKVIINLVQIPARSLWKYDMITETEAGQDARHAERLYLGHTVISLGRKDAIHSELDLYHDALKQLDLGVLYFYYLNDPEALLKRKMLPSYMFPITFESIHKGIVRGRERIVTKKGGAYGWAGDQSLHAVYFSDNQGMIQPNPFVTTVDKAGARTQLSLRKDEAAVVRRIPIKVDSNAHLNFITRAYSAKSIHLLCNGTGGMTLKIEDGEFRVRPGDRFQVSRNQSDTEVAATGKELKIHVPLSAQTEILIHPVE